MLVAPRIEGYTEGELARVPYAEMAGRTRLSADDPNEKAVLRMLWTVEKTGADAAAGRAARGFGVARSQPQMVAPNLDPG